MSTQIKVPAIEGAKVVEVRDMTMKEQCDLFGMAERFCAAKVVVLDTGVCLFPSRDPELNGPGFVLGGYKGNLFDL